MESWLYAQRFFLCMQKIIKWLNTNEGKTWNKIKYLKNNHRGKVTRKNTLMNKKNDFFVNCYGNKFADVYRT